MKKGDNLNKFTIKSPFFINNMASIEYLIANYIINAHKVCCNQSMPLKIYIANLFETVYCMCSKYSRRISLYSLCPLKNCKIKLNDMHIYLY